MIVSRHQQNTDVHAVARRAVVSLFVLSMLVSVGCQKLTTDYGHSKGSLGRNSLNGFGALRNSFELAGFRDRDVTRLSERVRRVDVIVWTPKFASPVNTKVTGWFDRWLRSGGRTLVYIVPDSGSETDYWMDASKLAPPEQRLEYRKRAAQSINQRMQWRMNRRSVQGNGWFLVEPLVNRELLGDVSGPWEKDVCQSPDEQIDIASEYRVDRFNADKSTAAKTAAAAGGGFVGPTGPSSPIWSFPAETSKTSTPIKFRPLLQSESGVPIVAEVTSTKWRDSKILVVSGGSLLTNYAFTRPFNRKLADKLVAQSIPRGKSDLSAGFLSTSDSQVAVSERKPGAPKASGMELLTVWPLSIVTIHGVMLGLVICLMLYPIFGRPKRVATSHQNNFGDHLDAVAALMNKSGGEAYARARISEYMKRMHGETSGEWVLPDPPPNLAATNMPAFSPKHFGASKQTPNTPVVDGTNDSADLDSLLDQALSADEQGIDEFEPLQDIAVVDNEAWFATLQSIFLQHLRQLGLQADAVDRGVAIANLQITWSNCQVTGQSDSSVSCKLQINAALNDPTFGTTNIQEIHSSQGKDSEQAVHRLAETYLQDVLPAILSLRGDKASDAISPVQLDSFESTLNRAITWDVFPGRQQIVGDSDHWLSAKLSDPFLLNSFFATVTGSDVRPSIHTCNIRASSDASQHLQLECFIDGQRAPQAEKEMRDQFLKDGPVQGIWELRQFFTIRPSGLSSDDDAAMLPDPSRQTFPDEPEEDL